jgi:hypothetical protein
MGNHVLTPSGAAALAGDQVLAIAQADATRAYRDLSCSVSTLLLSSLWLANPPTYYLYYGYL